jgi:chemotaxis protein methyltransferase WspC
MILAEFERLLKRTIGLDSGSIGSSSIERAVRVRLAACELEDVHTYWHRVCESEAELQELIEAVIVPETWFFRDGEAFAALARMACED